MAIDYKQIGPRTWRARSLSYGDPIIVEELDDGFLVKLINDGSEMDRAFWKKNDCSLDSAFVRAASLYKKHVPRISFDNSEPQAVVPGADILVGALLILLLALAVLGIVTSLNN